ncbi:unnamed protein product [Phytomonas sp. EM1]|nr:unnamed protein product [Phytomonas sp. EM1]|eukprot:CCW61518.1 unnamed protein product [Phytomonas sp. isolate EM1]
MDPQFATVTFVGEGDGIHAGTFRVPISHETTIRQLAKDSVQRFVLSRRGSKQTSPIRVTEVRVGGCTPSCAELFSKDMVTQVVLVKEEVIFMKLQFAAALPAKPEPEVASVPKSLPPALPLPLEEGKLNDCSRATKLPEPSGLAATHFETDKVYSESTQGTQNSLVHVAPSFSSKRRARIEEETSQDVLEAVRSIQKLERARLGWGPEASKHFPDNYVSSPQKLMRRRKASAPKTSAKRQDHPESKSDKAAALGIKASVGSLPPGWGPEAHKCFPSNYVSSPDRLVREIRSKKRREEAELKQKMMLEEEESSQPSKPKLGQSSTTLPSVATARQLDFSEIDEYGGDQTSCRPTIGHKVNPILVGETEGD